MINDHSREAEYWLMDRRHGEKPLKTDLETAMREAERAVRQGRPGDPVVIAAAALWELSQIIFKQEKTIQQLRGKR